MPLTPGTRLGPYQILAPLGAGGMGEVYRASDTRLERNVAIKVMPEHLSADAEVRARFVREARTVSSLNHPNICTLFDVGREGERDYLVMELVEGETLASRLARGPLAVAEVIRVGTQLAEALDRAHRAGVIHRDLKPANVMLAKSGAKLMDFGLARAGRRAHSMGAGAALSVALTQSPTTAQPLTSHGMIVGTVPYMAPEQLEGHEVDARTDLWALGCVLYEMATGRRAFDGSTQASLISSIMKDEPRALTDISPVTPALLDRVVRACLAKDPAQRWQNAHDVVIALRWPSVAAGTEVVARNAPPAEREFVLTAAHVRQLTDHNPQLVGYPLSYVDNQIASERLIVYMHGVGADSGKFEEAVRTSEDRAVAVSLVGFSPRDRKRPVLSVDNQSRVLRMFLRELVKECRPAVTLLVGHATGADQLLRMVHDEPGAGIPVDGLIALCPNVSLETCFATTLYSKLDGSDPGGTLAILKALAKDIDKLETWLVVQNYLTQTLLSLGTDIEPLRRFSAEIVAPFEQPGDPLADWYRAARRQIPFVRLVFSSEEARAAEALLARHIESNVMGDDFTESSFVLEPSHHLGLLSPEVVGRHLRDAFAALGR